MSTSRITPELLRRWRDNPIEFISSVLINPESGQPFQLLDAERQFLDHAFKLGDDGRLLYPEQIYSCPKKSGKTTFAAIYLLTVILLFGPPNGGDAYVLASDFEQAQNRVFDMCRDIVRASPLLKREAKLLSDRIIFAHGATITALPADYASAAGGHPIVSCFDELWTFVSQRSFRLWDEMVPVPTRQISVRLVTTHAGFSGESELLEGLYARGKEQPEVAPDLHAGNGILMYWTHELIAPWQNAAWVEQMKRSLRPAQFQRMVLNYFTSPESVLLDLAEFDKCIDTSYEPPLLDRDLSIFVGVDASVRHDQTALMAVAYDREQQRCRLVAHKIFQPSPERPLDFQRTIENTLHIWRGRFRLRSATFDSFQMVSTAQRLQQDGIKMVEMPQTLPNLSEATSNLIELIKSRRLLLYPAPDIRAAMSRAILIESARGVRIGKQTASHKIDAIVALSFACLTAVRSANTGRLLYRGVNPYGSDRTPLFEMINGEWRQIDEPPRMRLVRDPDGGLKLRGGDHSAIPTRRKTG